MKLSKKAIYLIIAFMVVGFSVTATVLFVNGGARIASFEEDFDIYFSSAVLDGVDKSNVFITNDKKHITFETNKLKHVNDTSVLEFEVTNNSTQYDAEVVISCVTDNQEYISLETDKENYIISAQTRETGTLTTRLLKVADNFINATITCTLDTSAKEREVKLEKTLVDPTYQITGTLQDEDGTPLEEKNLVVFSDEPHYVTTDNFGFFYVSGLEKGQHEIYYVGEADVTDKSKSEIKAMAIDEAQITTNDTSIKFDELKLDEFVVEPVKTGNVDINFDADGGEVSETKKNVELYTRARDLPIPTRAGYTFAGWKYNGKIVSPNTIINDEKNLVATWNVNKYTVIFEGTNYTSSLSSIEIEYGSTGTVTIAPSNGYYIKSVLCSNGYTTNASVGTGVISNQAVTITNNSNPSNSTCTITVESRTYNASAYSASCTSKYGNGCIQFADCYGYDSYGNYVEHECNYWWGRYITTDCSSEQGCITERCTSADIITTCTCPSGGTLIGSSCYSCPNGGTLSGTTCNY